MSVLVAQFLSIIAVKVTILINNFVFFVVLPSLVVELSTPTVVTMAASSSQLSGMLCSMVGRSVWHLLAEALDRDLLLR